MIKSVFLILIFLSPYVSEAANYKKYLARKKNVQKSIVLATEYLQSATLDNGRYIYKQNTKVTDSSYNILRHAGTIYALCQSHLFDKNADLMSSIKKSTNYLVKTSILPLESTKLAVWSLPKITDSSLPTAKLGGTGLGLTALLMLEKISSNFTQKDTLQKLGEFILFMQKDDGSFYSKYTPSLGGLNKKWVSLYYPGEAALGLLMLYEYDGQKKWLEGAKKALLYLAEIRKGKEDTPIDHWALIATKKLFSIDSLEKTNHSLLLNHAIQICRKIIAHKEKNILSPYYGSYLNGRTAPTATRLEGLLSVLDFLPVEYDSLRNEIETTVLAGISFLLSVQDQSEKYKGGFPRSLSYGIEKEFIQKRSNEIRIDYVQHSLSAMIHFYYYVGKYGKKRSK